MFLKAKLLHLDPWNTHAIIHLHIYKATHTHTHTHTHTRIRTHTHTHTHAYAHTRTYTHAHIYTHIYAHTRLDWQLSMFGTGKGTSMDVLYGSGQPRVWRSDEYQKKY